MFDQEILMFYFIVRKLKPLFFDSRKADFASTVRAGHQRTSVATNFTCRRAIQKKKCKRF